MTTDRLGPGATPRAAADHDTGAWDESAIATVRLRISRRHPASTVIDVAGEVDIVTCPLFSQTLTTTVDASAGHAVVVDLTRTTFLAACGVAVLRRARAEARQRNGSLQVVVAPTNPAAGVIRRAVHTGDGPPIRTSLGEADDAARSEIDATSDHPTGIRPRGEPGRRR